MNSLSIIRSSSCFLSPSRKIVVGSSALTYFSNMAEYNMAPEQPSSKRHKKKNKKKKAPVFLYATDPKLQASWGTPKAANNQEFKPQFVDNSVRDQNAWGPSTSQSQHSQGIDRAPSGRNNSRDRHRKKPDDHRDTSNSHQDFRGKDRHHGHGSDSHYDRGRGQNQRRDHFSPDRARSGQGHGDKRGERGRPPRDFTFFDNKSPFSPYHLCSFLEGGVTYTSVAQYVIHQKAVFFEDRALANEVLAAKQARQWRDLDKKSSGYKDPDWGKYEHKNAIRYGNLAKFSQDEKLRDFLLTTKDTSLVFAVEDDRHWSIGKNADDPVAKTRNSWKGWNLFGNVLTDVRDELIAKSKYTFFFGWETAFSQHHPCEFEIKGLTYNCAEQYMMHQKAVTFEDNYSARQIMKTEDPKWQKALGRKVENFVPEIWDLKSPEVVKTANIAKFSQNPKLKEQLFATGRTKLVEASPFDQLWGIGLSESDRRAWDEATWRGRNQLGRILTEVREILKKGDEEARENENSKSDGTCTAMEDGEKS